MAIDYGESTLISGAARSDNINQSGLVIDMEKMTHKLDENPYVFEALTRKVNKIKVCDRMKHEYREKRLIRNIAVLSADANAGATSATINDYIRIKANFLIYNPRTTDLMLVATAPSSTTVSFVDAVAGSGGTTYAWTAGDVLIILGESHAEGNEVPEAYSNDSINKFDYIMQKDRRITCTDIEEAENHYDAEEMRMSLRIDAMTEYRQAMNMLFYVGKNGREIVSASGPRRHCCGGLIEKINENVTDFSTPSTPFTLSALESMLQSTKYHSASSPSKMGLFGTRAWAQISNWGRDALQVSTNSKEWGLSINKLITGHGDLEVAFDPVLNETNGLHGMAFILDLKHISQLQMRGLPVRVYMDIKNLSTIHQSVDAITGTFGLQLLFPELHARGINIQ